MEKRTRSIGWKHAKNSGHENEERVKNLIENDYEYAYKFLERIGVKGKNIENVEVGGLHEPMVPSISGRRKTKSKTDLKIFLSDGGVIKVSIKKSFIGQVYFVGAKIFFETFEKQFDKEIPHNVKRAINLFWHSADDAEDIIKEYADKDNEKEYKLQMRHKSLNAETLRKYNGELYHAMIEWFKENSYQLAKLCFSKGAAVQEGEWCDYVWYINLLGEHKTDEIFLIEDICRASCECANSETYYGDKNGGTAIQLPFGFVEWHQGKLQFHHNYKKIKHILN